MESKTPRPSVAWYLLGLAVLIFGGQWGFSAPRQPAGIPDTGAQMQQLIDEVKGVNRRLDLLQSLLDSGKLQVQVQNPEKKKE